MFAEIRISWPLVLAVAMVALTVMAALHLAEVGQETAYRVFVWPIERMLRLSW